jgi:hypothetical protein
MRIRQYTLAGGGAANTATYSALAAPSAGVPLTLTGAAASISPGRELTFTSAGDASAVTFTIVGKDTYGGNVLTETITGPNANTVRTRKIYSSITSITPSATSAQTVSVGNAQRVCGNWINSNSFMSRDSDPTMRCSTEIVTGAPTGAWEFTNENVTQITGGGAFVDGTVASTPAAGGDTASVQGAYVRYVCTSAAGSLKARFVAPSF